MNLKIKRESKWPNYVVYDSKEIVSELIKGWVIIGKQNVPYKNSHVARLSDYENKDG